jgi:hypothetical protein
MKFSTLAISSLTLLIGKTEARKKMNSSMIQRKLDTMDKHSFLKRVRKLQDENEEFVISANTNFKFNSCITIESDDDDQENNENDAEAGTQIQQYIIVDIVGSNGKASYEYAMDIGTFVSSTGSMIVNQVESYCEVCKEAAEYCTDEQSGYGWNQGSATYYDADEDKTVEFIDCNTCAVYNCYEENNNGRKLEEDVDMESIFDYLDQVGQCQEYSYTYSNQEYKNDYNPDDYQDDAVGTEALYIGYMCNEDGTGIELGFFYDEDCSIYTEGVSIEEQLGENSLAMQYLTASQSLVEGVFLNQHSCSNLEYANPFDDQDDEAQNGGSQWYQTAQSYSNQYQTPQANEACTEVFEGENSIALGLCDGDDATEICEALAEWEGSQSNFNYWGNENQGCSTTWLSSVFDCEENEENQNAGYDYRAWSDNNSPQNESKFVKIFGPVGGMLMAVAIGALLAVGLAGVVIQIWNRTVSEGKKEAVIKEEEYAAMDDKDAPVQIA